MNLPKNKKLLDKICKIKFSIVKDGKLPETYKKFVLLLWKKKMISGSQREFLVCPYSTCYLFIGWDNTERYQYDYANLEKHRVFNYHSSFGSIFYRPNN